MEKEKEKIDWKNEIMSAILSAVVIIILFNFYCNWKSRDRMEMEDFKEVCREKGQKFSHYKSYPDDSIRVVCRNPDYTFSEVLLNASI